MKKENTDAKADLLDRVTQAVRADWFNDYIDLIDLIDGMVYEAYIAGFSDTKGIHLNLSKEERSDEYCRGKGLRS